MIFTGKWLSFNSIDYDVHDFAKCVPEYVLPVSWCIHHRKALQVCNTMSRVIVFSRVELMSMIT